MVVSAARGTYAEQERRYHVQQYGTGAKPGYARARKRKTTVEYRTEGAR